MDLESLNTPQRSAVVGKPAASLPLVCMLAYQSFGVVYGDLSVSPLYVFRSTFSGDLKNRVTEEEIWGVLSLIFWTLMLIPVVKYALIVLSADDNGEGGTFALYSLLCRHAKLSVILNQQSADAEVSTYNLVEPPDIVRGQRVRKLLDKYTFLRTGLLLLVLLGTSMVIGDGVLTPSISVLSVISGITVAAPHLHQNVVVVVSCFILVLLYALQHIGTRRISFLFAPIVLAWLFCNVTVGVYNLIAFNPSIVRALSPCYIYRFFKVSKKDVWIALGGVLLCITALASMVESQAVISATFSIIEQSQALGCFPWVKVVHTSNTIYRQICILEANWILLILSLSITIGFQNTIEIGNAYGIAMVVVILVTTFLTSFVMAIVWHYSLFLITIFFLIFGSIESFYLSSTLFKVPQGGWMPLILASLTTSIMYTWHYNTTKKYKFDLDNKVSMKWLLTLGLDFGIVCIPGIGLVYTRLVTGVPTIFSHFLANLLAFHEVLVFVCMKSVLVLVVPSMERYLIGRVGPKGYRMYRCVIRYGYKDKMEDDDNDFENELICI